MKVIETRRKGIPHLHQMKDLTFVEFCLSLDDGVIKNLKTVMKVDGLSARFGKDINGNIFLESARSGPVFEVGAFSLYTIKKGMNKESIERSKHYDDILRYLKTSDVLNDLPNDTKIVCEMLYKPLAQETPNGFRFVWVEYSKDCVKNPLTILPYYSCRASTGEKINDAHILVKQNEFLQCKTPHLTMGNIDVKNIISPILQLNKEDIRVLSSLKHIDKPYKKVLKETIQQVKIKLTDVLLTSKEIKGKYTLGPNIEGIVVWVNNNEYKCITKEFKNGI